MSARLQKSLIVALGAAALVRAQEVSLPVEGPTDTAVVSLPTVEPTETEVPSVTEPSFSDTVITDVPTSTGGDVSLPWITGTSTITATDEDGQTTIDTISNNPPSATTGSGSATDGTSAPTGSSATDAPSVTTVTSTSTGGDDSETTASGTDAPTPTESDGSEGGGESESPTAGANARPEAVGMGFLAVLAGILAL